MDTGYDATTGQATGYWRTYTVTEYAQHCYRNWHKHVVDVIVQNVAVSLMCGGVGFLVGGPIGAFVGSAVCSTIVAVTTYVWGPSH